MNVRALLWGWVLCLAAIFSSNADDLFVTDVQGNAGLVYRYKPDGTRTIFATNGWNAGGIAIDRSAGVWVSGLGDSTTRYSLAGLPTRGTVDGSMYIAAVPDGTVYIRRANLPRGYPGLLIKITPDGGYSYIELTDNAGSLAVSSAGDLYYRDGGAIHRIKPNGTNEVFRNIGADSLTFDYKDTLYYTLGGDLYKTALTGSPELVATNFSGFSVAVDTIGNVYASNPDEGVIKKLSPSGQVTVFASGLAFPRSIAVLYGPTISITLNAAEITVSASDPGRFQLYGATNLASPNWVPVSWNTPRDNLAAAMFFRIQR